jgi:hypothetical protein
MSNPIDPINFIEGLIQAAQLEAYDVSEKQTHLNPTEVRAFGLGYIAARVVAIQKWYPQEYALWQEWDADQTALELEKEDRKAFQHAQFRAEEEGKSC